MATTTVHAGIDQTNRAFEKAAMQGDSAGMADVYTEHGQILPPNGQLTTGKPAIQSFWQQVLDMGIKEIELETVELEVHGDTAWEVGRAALKLAGGQVADTVKYIVIWKEENGRWLWHRDIWNSNSPA